MATPVRTFRVKSKLFAWDYLVEVHRHMDAGGFTCLIFNGNVVCGVIESTLADYVVDDATNVCESIDNDYERRIRHHQGSR